MSCIHISAHIDDDDDDDMVLHDSKSKAALLRRLTDVGGGREMCLVAY